MIPDRTYVRVRRILKWLLPAEFDQRWGDEIADTTVDRCRDARAMGMRSFGGFFGREVASLLWMAVALRSGLPAEDQEDGIMGFLQRRTVRNAVLLGVVGGAMVIAGIEYFRDGPAEISPGLLLLLVAPLVFRFSRPSAGFRELGAANLVVGWTMTAVVFAKLTLIDPAPALPLGEHLWRLIAGLGYVSPVALACTGIAHLYFIAGSRSEATGPRAVES